MDLKNIMQQAQAMQQQMAEVQEKIDQIEAQGEAGAGLVSVTLKGKGELVGLSVDSSLMDDDAEILEDLIKAAHADARRKLDEAMEAAMKEATKGLGGGMLPGFKLPF